MMGSCLRRSAKLGKANDQTRLRLSDGEPENGATYLGVTSDLVQRAYQHRETLVEGHSKDNDCKRLVWFEAHDDIQDARAREWQMKKWKRAWKIKRIEERNPEWRDLWFEIVK